jgi:hypothetical protein
MPFLKIKDTADTNRTSPKAFLKHILAVLNNSGTAIFHAKSTINDAARIPMTMKAVPDNKRCSFDFCLFNMMLSL